MTRITVLLTLALSACAAAPAAAREALESGAPFPPVLPAETFPVLGPVDYGTRANHFGGRPGHRGHDVFADCGTPLVAAAGGRVERAGTDGAAGNHVVIRTESGRSHVYMHLRLAPRVRAGDTVTAGRRLGSVGDSGNAWDCHLHFEIWTAPGWYRGRAIDPEPFLRRAGG